ncbi:MAG TPA: hypothetical protein VHL80_02370 [Polyangia bacterium]|nr:hypothetical protein [Polyangia bacterium]
MILGALLSLNCAGDKAPGGDLGEMRLALTLPDGESVSSVSWQVLSSSSAVVASGMLNTSGNRSISFISSMPPGMGDTVTMSAMTSTGVSCMGTSSAFNVVAGQSVPVSVNLQCDVSPGDGGVLGSVVVSGAIVPGDHCPTLASYFISPQGTMGSTPIDVTVTGADSDPGDTLTYAWTASSGTFANAAVATTEYTCGATGMQTLTVAITDDHAPTPCTTHVTFPAVDCQ